MVPWINIRGELVSYAMEPHTIRPVEEEMRDDLIDYWAVGGVLSLITAWETSLLSTGLITSLQDALRLPEALCPNTKVGPGLLHKCSPYLRSLKVDSA
ncbi:hypothetical protein TNCV_2287681 [Trichonephila clavipes]|nr:hypothetical protein TNCV_2287681 [Trichonephila clavipes]